MGTEPTEPAESTRTEDAATSSRSVSVSASTSASTPVPESGSVSEFESESKSGPGPDWIQFLLVVLTVLVLALAAIAIPALGGGGDGTRSAAGAGNLLELGAGGNDSADGTAGTGGAARSGNGSTELGSGSESGNGSGGSASSGEGGGGGEAVPNRGGETSGEGRDGDGDGFSGGSGGGGESGESGFESDESGTGDEGGAGGGQSEDGETGGDSGGETGEGVETGAAGGNGTAGEPGAGGEFGADPDEGDEFGDEAGDEFGQGGSGSAESDGGGNGEVAGDGEGAPGAETESGGADSDDGFESSEGGDESAAGSGGAEESAERDGSSGGTDGETESEGAASGYDISFDESPTPGSEVEVTVTEDGDPLPGATVSFNGNPIGTTGVDGVVSGTVPFTETVTVAVEPRGQGREREREQTHAQEPTTARDPAVRGAIGARLGGSSIQFYGGNVAGPPARLQDESADEGGASNESARPGGRAAGTERTVEMDAETTLAISRAGALADDDAVPSGTNVTVTAAVEGNPIPAGTVLLDGEQVGTTDEFGTAEIEMPETRGETTIAVERDDIRAERTVGVYGLSIEVAERLPLPGRTVEATVQYDGGSAAARADEAGDGTGVGGEATAPDAPTAVENATLLIDGEPVATTGTDGTATVSLPVSNEATISARVSETTAETTLTGLYRNAAVVATAGLTLVTLLGWFLKRRFGMTTATVRTLPERVRRLLARTGEFIRDLGRRAVEAVVRLAAALERVGDWLAVQGRAALRALRRTGRRLRGLPGELAERGLAALAALHPRRLAAFIRTVLRSLRRSDRERKAESASDVHAEIGETESAREPGGRRRTVRRLWREFVRAVRPPGVRTKTAGEIGRYAVERGFPERPVRTVVEVFRDAEYGESSPAEPRIERVQAAVRSVAGDTAAPADAGAETGARAAEAEREGKGTTDTMPGGEHESNREDEPVEEAEEGDRP